MGWLIDPEEQTVFVYQTEREIQIFDELYRLLPMPHFAEGLHLNVGQLFEWLME